MAHFLRSHLTRVLGMAAAVTLLVAPSLAAQTGTIVGRVTNATSGQPIPTAQVFIGDLDIGALTQQNGAYLLLNVPAGTRTVSVQRIGYRQATQDVTVAAGQTVTLDFRISEEALQLDEVIVTGTAGGTQRRAIGNTVQTLGVSDIVQDVAITNMQEMLTGRSSGLRFTRLSGNVGTGSPISIRGVGSFDQGRNQPLIYVDGVRVNNEEEAGPTLGSGSNVNVLDDFNPEDIESIEIIKGPAAASLYGTEASAGVIQIITKKGREGAPEFNVSVRQGTNYMPNPAARLGTYYTCPTDNSPGPTDCQNESDLVSYNMYEEGTRYIAEGYFPWPSENLYANGSSQGYNVDVRGGTNSIRYFLSGNYDDETGIVHYNTDETFRLRGNVGVVFSEMFSLDLSTGYVDGATRFAAPTVSDGGIWQDLLWSNGYYLDRINPFDGSGPGSQAANPRLGGFQEHLPTDVEKIEATRDYSRFTGAATLNFTTGSFDVGGSTSGTLTSRAVLGLDKGWDINRNMFPLHDTNDVPANLQAFTSSWSSVYSETDNGQMTYAEPVSTNLSFDLSATLSLDIADTYTANTSVGAQYYVDRYENFSNTGQGFASPLSTTINQISQANIVTTYSLVENLSLGFFIQEELGWNDRLFLTAAVRFDDNSTFGVEAPAEKYPKVSGTWVVSEESFWNFDAVSSLRVRGAWGKAGRQPSALAGQNIYVAMPGPGGTSAIRPSAPGNLGVEPEVSTELELGFDVGLFNDRVSGEFTQYWRKDRGALLGVAIPDSYGFPGSVDSNIGKIDNWGWEASLSSRLYEGDLFSFDLDLGADYTMNEIKDLRDTYTGVLKIGTPYPYMQTSDWVLGGQFEAGGSFANAFGQRFNATCDLGVSLAPDPNAADAGRWATLPGGDEVDCFTNQNLDLYAGRGFAPWTFSVAPRLSLLDNQLQVFAMAEGQYGRIGQENGHAWGHIYNNSLVSRLEDDPKWVASQTLNGTSGYDWTKAMYNADFWKLREVGLRYNLPSSLTEKAGASRASLALSARNVWTIWQAQEEIYGHPVSDPEYGTSSLDGTGNFWETPAIASLNATLRVTF
jgi:TonB-linked SusC/RagA family outer membrane protein